MLSFPISILCFIFILDITYWSNNMCQVVFGKIHMVWDMVIVSNLEPSSNLQSTRYGICAYPNWSICWVDYRLETFFGVSTHIGVENAQNFVACTAKFHLNLTKDSANWKKKLGDNDAFTNQISLGCSSSLAHAEIVAIKNLTK